MTIGCVYSDNHYRYDQYLYSSLQFSNQFSFTQSYNKNYDGCADAYIYIVTT